MNKIARRTFGIIAIVLGALFLIVGGTDFHVGIGAVLIFQGIGFFK